MKKLILLLVVVSILRAHQSLSQTAIPYGSNQGRYLTIENTKIYYEEYGKGMPLLLLHGGLGSISNFEQVIPELSKKFHVIAADSPSHGRSGQIENLTYSNMASYFSKMIDMLKVDSIYVMGWSDGAVISLLLAADRPDKVKRIIATGANTRADGVNQASIDWTNNISVEAVEIVKDHDAFVGEWLRTYKKLSGSEDSWKKYVVDVKKLWLTEIYITEDKLKSIAIPVMLVVGDKDVIKLDHAIVNHRLISGSQFCVLPNTTHDVYREKPQLINAIAMDFFK
jgi:pimeloyl-ACP methyl ester carboxylesterase